MAVEKMKVLSLFDGMSCGMVALKRIGIPVSQYFSSEIDKYAITVSRRNHPEIIQIGDVRNVRRMVESGVFGKIDLLIGGSPCQGFSFAGKQLAFNDPRSALFFEYAHILQALRRSNPEIKFLLENVKMKKEYLDVISQFLGVQPVLINSALVSAQNRNRFYWMNWNIEQPEDKRIFLKDILEETFTSDVFLKSGQINRLKNSNNVQKRFSVIDPKKAACMTARQYASWKGNFITLNPARVKNLKTKDDKSFTLLSSLHKGEQANGQTLLTDGVQYRKLTLTECERLQNLSDGYTEGVSNTQRYKMLGNGWTVDVVAHILRGMPK
jgi:DNA-cytosine methyltransferase